jgi:hypothetical protein
MMMTDGSSEDINNLFKTLHYVIPNHIRDTVASPRVCLMRNPQNSKTHAAAASCKTSEILPIFDLFSLLHIFFDKDETPLAVPLDFLGGG